MNKRLLAGFMVLCLAAGATHAAFAEDPPASAPLHTGIAADETAAPGRPASAPTATPESAGPDAAAPHAVTLTSLTLQDEIISSGELIAMVNGSREPAEGVQYTWYRSKSGAPDSWAKITGQAVCGDARNLAAARPQALNAALDTLLARRNDPACRDTDRYHYRVVVTAGGITLQAEAQAGYYVQLQNGSFETPSAIQNTADRFYYPEGSSTAAHFLQTLDAGTNPGIYWRTTAYAARWISDAQNKPGSGNYIEIADAGDHLYTEAANDPAVEYHIDSAYDGTQFAELNCQHYGALYQDVLTVPGTVMNWSLAHAGRDGTDTMALLICPAEAAEQITAKLDGKSTRAEIEAVLADHITMEGQAVPIRHYVVDGNITDSSGTWGVHGGTYTVPAGQYVSRFFLLALASASGDGTEGIRCGNLIDRVWFSADPVPPVSRKGTLRITKTLLRADGTALTDAELVQAKQNLRFTVVNSKCEIVGNFSGSQMQADTSGADVLQFTLQLPLTDRDGNPYTYAVTETARGEPTGYDCTRVRTLGADGSWIDITQTAVHSGITLTTQAETKVWFENTYAERPARTAGYFASS